MLSGRQEDKLIRIVTVRHKHSDLLMAFSDDLPGLLVPARSHDELAEKLPEAVKEILEAEGFKVASVKTEDEGSDLPEGFARPTFLARAETYI